MEHKDLVREEFTRQANDYATAPAIRDAEHLRKLVEIVAPPADARVLEVATGPGHVAMAFAAVCPRSCDFVAEGRTPTNGAIAVSAVGGAIL